MTNLKLSRPLAFFDLETTGVQVDQDRIVSIYIMIIKPNDEKLTFNQLINPTIPIPKEASDVHGITDEMVATEPTFKDLAKDIFELLDGCDLAGYNSNRFDIPLLIMEFHRCQIEFPTHDPVMFDGMLIETVLKPRTLSEVYKNYTGVELDDAHDASADVGATFTVLDYQLDAIRKQFPDVLENDKPFTPEILESFGNNGKTRFDYSGKCHVDDDGNVCWSFGKNRNKPVSDDWNYLNWVLNANFPPETKTKLKKYAEYMRPVVSFLGYKKRIDRSELTDEFDIDFNGSAKIQFQKDGEDFIAVNGMDGGGNNIQHQIKGQKLIIK